MSISQSFNAVKAEKPADDDIMAALNRATDDMMSMDPKVMEKAKEQKIQDAMQKLKEANIKKVTSPLPLNGCLETKGGTNICLISLYFLLFS